ncbi:MAG: hypothetical protein M3380_01465 [Chloroflexota bacterium]|nr:hypothetical protein [Chloroflexota bacterium]
MTVTIDLPPELVTQLRDAAAQAGLDTNEYIVNVLQARLGQFNGERGAIRLPTAEAALLQQVNQGFPQQTWQQYNELVAKRRAETLTPDEHTALIELGDQIEQANARRIAALVELATLRNTTLEDLMRQLGISAPTYV